MNWLISANSRIYDHASSFEHHNFIDWRQGQTHYEVGDTVYIYCTTPIQSIRYQCRVSKTGMPFDEIRDDREYWKEESEYLKALQGKFVRLDLIAQIENPNLSLQSLKAQGLRSAPQGPMRLQADVLQYVQTQFKNVDNDDFFPEIIDSNLDVFEGLKKQITVNKYERSSIARAKCIELHGCTCSLCSFDFEKVYGDVGKSFIHVHHIKPLHTIGANYKLDYESDLIPVCPNCHAMLHKKVDGEELSLAELKERIEKSN
jgi:5-methylcytosine-specific restriction protein A